MQTTSLTLQTLEPTMHSALIGALLRQHSVPANLRRPICASPLSRSHYRPGLATVLRRPRAAPQPARRSRRPHPRPPHLCLVVLHGMHRPQRPACALSHGGGRHPSGGTGVHPGWGRRPRLNAFGEVDYRLQALLFHSWKRVDPPPTRVKPMPLSLMRHAHALTLAQPQAHAWPPPATVSS